MEPNEAKGGPRLSLLRLQDYAEDARANSDVMAAVRLTRIQPLVRRAPFRRRRPPDKSRAQSPEGSVEKAN